MTLSPQRILGAKHAGSRVSARAALERAVIGSFSLCVSGMLMCSLVCLVSQTHRPPVLANGEQGKTFQ